MRVKGARRKTCFLCKAIHTDAAIAAGAKTPACRLDQLLASVSASALGPYHEAISFMITIVIFRLDAITIVMYLVDHGRYITIVTKRQISRPRTLDAKH